MSYKEKSINIDNCIADIINNTPGITKYRIINSVIGRKAAIKVNEVIKSKCLEYNTNIKEICIIMHFDYKKYNN